MAKRHYRGRWMDEDEIRKEDKAYAAIKSKTRRQVVDAINTLPGAKATLAETDSEHKIAVEVPGQSEPYLCGLSVDCRRSFYTVRSGYGNPTYRVKVGASSFPPKVIESLAIEILAYAEGIVRGQKINAERRDARQRVVQGLDGLGIERTVPGGRKHDFAWSMTDDGHIRFSGIIRPAEGQLPESVVPELWTLLTMFFTANESRRESSSNA